MTLAFDAHAAREVLEAYTLHERERPGHGELLVSEIEGILARAARFPRSGARVRDLEPHDVRSFGLRRFPYALIVAHIADTPTVVAFAHTKREPSYWRDRVE